jgi:hypothetical protein
MLFRSLWNNFIFVLVFACCSRSLFSQPNVDLHTGQLSFSKTLTVAQGHSISLPVNLSYNSFISTDDYPSWAGSGFDVEMPYIERKLVGAPDEYFGIGERFSGDGIGFLSNVRSRFSLPVEASTFFDYTTYWPLKNCWFLPPEEWGIEDAADCEVAIGGNPFYMCFFPSEQNFHYENGSQQDIYTLHGIGGGSTRLFFSTQEKDAVSHDLIVSTSPYKSWDIQYNDNWIIRDENGTKYTFDKQVITKRTGGANRITNYRRTYERNPDGTYSDLGVTIAREDYSYISRWYLTKVESYTGEVTAINYLPMPKRTITEYDGLVDGRIWQGTAENLAVLKYNLELPFTINQPTRGFLAFRYKGSLDSYSSFKTCVRELARIGDTQLFGASNQQIMFQEGVRIYDVYIFLEFPPQTPSQDKVWHWTSDPQEVGILEIPEKKIGKITCRKSVDESSFEGTVCDQDCYESTYGYDNSICHCDGECQNLGVFTSADNPSTWAQTVGVNNSREVNGWQPTSIISSLAQVYFDPAASPTYVDEFGRSPLGKITVKDGKGVTQKELTFYHSLAPSIPDFSDPTTINPQLKLDSIYERSGTVSRRSYKFLYQAPPCINQTSRQKRINTIVGLQGDSTVYTYEPGAFGAMTDGSSFAPKIGYQNRVSQVVEHSSFLPAGRTRQYTISYSNDYGEINHTDCIGVELALSFHFEHIDLSNYGVAYGKVQVSTPGAGSTQYNFATAKNPPLTGYFDANPAAVAIDLKDDPNEYHLNSSYRGLLWLVRYYNQASPPKCTESKQYIYHLEKAGPDGFVRNRYSYWKPQTWARQYEMRDMPENFCGAINPGVCRDIPSKGYAPYGMMGYPQAMIVRSCKLLLDKEIETVDGVKKEKAYAYNGIDNYFKLKSTSETNSNGEARTTEYAYGFQQYPDMGTAGLIDPIVKTEIKRSLPSPTATTKVVKANASRWKQWPSIRGAAKWMPLDNHAWLSVYKGVDGWPDPEYIACPYYTDPGATQTSNWPVQSEILRYSNVWKPLSVKANGILTTNTIYDEDSQQVCGTIVNANYLECGLLSGTYDRNEFDPHNGFYWIDKQYGWRKLMGASSPSISAVSNTELFGQKVLKVQNASAARPFKLAQGKNYLMSAWVKVESGQLKIAGSYLKACSGDNEPSVIVCATPSLAMSGAPKIVSTTSGWQYIEVPISAGSDIPSSQWTEQWYANMSIGTKDGGVAYLSDIRFAPSDALVSTQYYDTHHNVICTIDANNNGAYAVYDDWNRVKEQRNSKKQLVKSFAYKLAGDR